MNYYNVFVRGLCLQQRRGSAHNKLSLSVELKVETPCDFHSDRYKFVVCYDRIVKGAKSLSKNRVNANLFELAKSVVGLCLEDERVQEAHVAIAPTNAFEAGMGGVEIRRRRANTTFGTQQPIRLAETA